MDFMCEFLTTTQRPRWQSALLVFGLTTTLFVVSISSRSLLIKGVVLAELVDVEEVEFDNELDLITVLYCVLEIRPCQYHWHSDIEPRISLVPSVAIQLVRGPPIC
jgi:hypothetical protein